MQTRTSHSFNCQFSYRYFEEDEETEHASLEYIPAPGSPTGKPSVHADTDDDEDPLDAFMAGIEKQVDSYSEFADLITYVSVYINKLLVKIVHSGKERSRRCPVERISR